MKCHTYLHTATLSLKNMVLHGTKAYKCIFEIFCLTNCKSNTNIQNVPWNRIPCFKFIFNLFNLIRFCSMSTCLCISPSWLVNTWYPDKLGSIPLERFRVISIAMDPLKCLECMYPPPLCKGTLNNSNLITIWTVCFWQMMYRHWYHASPF